MATIEFQEGDGTNESAWKRFEGKVKDGQLNGPGMLTLQNDTEEEGFWKQN